MKNTLYMPLTCMLETLTLLTIQIWSALCLDILHSLRFEVTLPKRWGFLSKQSGRVMLFSGNIQSGLLPSFAEISQQAILMHALNSYHITNSSSIMLPGGL